MKAVAFTRTADYLIKNDEEQTTINDLIGKMREFMEELLEIIYANNTVTHILSGKAVARAVRVLCGQGS